MPVFCVVVGIIYTYSKQLSRSPRPLRTMSHNYGASGKDNRVVAVCAGQPARSLLCALSSRDRGTTICAWTPSGNEPTLHRRQVFTGAYEPPAPPELHVLLEHGSTFSERRPEASLSASNCRGMVTHAKSVRGPSEGSRACTPYHPGRRLSVRLQRRRFVASNLATQHRDASNASLLDCFHAA